MENLKEVCVQSDDFSENLKSSFRKLREDTMFTDVTLACEDGEQVEAHKIILAGSSQLFRKLLTGGKQAYPFIYLRGVKLADLLAAMDYIYLGEARLAEEDFQSFLALASDLQLRGLESKQTADTTLVSDFEPHFEKSRDESKSVNQKTLHEIKFDFQEAEIRSARHQNIDDQVKSMIEIGDIPAPGRSQGRVRICKVCGKEGVTIAILGHVKAKHLKHLTTPSLPCEECGKQFISNRKFTQHMQQCAPRQMLSNVSHRAVGEPN